MDSAIKFRFYAKHMILLLTSPRGITAARPLFFFLRFGARPLGYVDFGDLKGLLCLLEPLGVSWRVLSPLDRLLGSLEALLEPPGVLLGPSWGALGGLWGRLRGDPNATKITCPKKVNFQTPKRRVPLQHGRVFGRPKSTKIGTKTS